MNIRQTVHSVQPSSLARTAGLTVVALAIMGSLTHAQSVDIEVPMIVLDDSSTGPADDTGELDLANIVQSAAKGVTTVQDAPAIVTVITSDTIRDRGWTELDEALDTVPGYMRVGALHNQFPFPTVRGVVQAVMFLMNGVSMFDAFSNVPSVAKQTPMEIVKRIEVVSGPGGVLWGANSYLGIMNVITKDAEDVDGVEADVGVGSGNGGPDYFRGYVMAGVTDLFNDSSKLFIHTSFETSREPGFQMPLNLFASALPQANGSNLYGPLTDARPSRSFYFHVDGKLTLGALEINFYTPIIQHQLSLGFSGLPVRETLPEDSLRNPDGSLACDPNNPPDPVATTDDRCLDVLRKARSNEENWYDRYVSAAYSTRFADGKAGLKILGYGVQFVRDTPNLLVGAPLPGILEGGINNTWDSTAYRAGLSVDGDVELIGNARLLYGAEAFHEWIGDSTSGTQTRQGAGVPTSFNSPYQLDRLPILCPRGRERDANGDLTGGTVILDGCPLTFLFQSSRTVLGTYVNPQWKISKRLTIDAGARLQVAPDALSRQDYPLKPLFGGGLVYRLAKNWHLKANYTEGLRAPVFNNTSSNGEAVAIGGSPDLKLETSQAGQAEINARLFKGERRIRELTFRADYSYTKLENLIQIQQGRYENTGTRAMHSAEMLAKLYVKGGHVFELGYSFLRMNTSDKGRHRSLPEHWFNFSGVLALADGFTATGNMRVIGAMEDPNRLVEYRPYSYDEEGQSIRTATGEREALLSQPHEAVFDRLPPVADLTLGLAYTGIDRLRLSAFAYNAFNARYFQPDVFYDFEPRIEYLPNPDRDFRFQVHATYSY